MTNQISSTQWDIKTDLDQKAIKEMSKIKMTKNGFTFRPDESRLEEFPNDGKTTWIDWLLHIVLWEYQQLTTEPSYYEGYEEHYGYEYEAPLPTAKQIDSYKKKLASFVVKWSVYSSETSEDDLNTMKRIIS